MEDLQPSFEDCATHLIQSVIDSTTPPNETALAAHLRAAAILEMVRGFEAATAYEAMLACHCVMLQYAAAAALRSLSASEGDETMLLRLRSSANALSRTLQTSLARHESVKARREARAAAGEQAPRAAPPSTRPHAPNTPPKTAAPEMATLEMARPEMARPEMARPEASAPALPPSLSSPRPGPFRMAPEKNPAHSLARAGLLASTGLTPSAPRALSSGQRAA